MRHLIYVIYILVSSISLHAQEFSPIVNLTLGNLMGGETSSLTYSMSQDNGESEIYSSSVVSDGGSFNLSGLSVNDNIGSGTLFLELYAGDYSLESDLIVSNINNDFYTVFNYVTASNSPDFGVGDIAGGFVISNTETGINIYTEIPGDEDFISEAYNMSLTFDDIFINPAQGSFTFTSTLTTELGDIDVQEFAFDVIVINGCMDPTSLTYNANANISDPSMCCYIGGCIDPAATNYDPNACFNTISCNFLVNNITQDTGYAVIQTAIDSSINGDTVIVSPGTYVENINFNGKNIVLASDFLLTNDTSYISSTIIDGNANGSPVVRLENGETNDAKLIGFTIQNGYTAINEEGAGIDLRFSAQPTLDYLIIQNNNSQSGRGGGISCYYTNGNSTSKVILSNLTIRNNICSDVGGGIYAFNSRLNISNSKIYENSAHFAGAIGGNGPFEPIVNCEFYDNIGNLSVMSGEFDLINCSFIDNYLTNPNSNVYELDFQGTSSIINTIIASGHPIKVNGQLSISHSLIQDSISSISYPFSNALVWGAGNLTLDPSFVDSSINDFRLSNFSPCIGAGLDTSIVPTYDLDGNPRPNPAGSNPDMGAYENSLASPDILGCMDSTSFTFNPSANIDDPSLCCYLGGCIDPAATNYDPNACFNTISCSFLVNNITQDTGYAVIQTAINAANSGDTVIVSPGTYSENLIWNKNIVLASEFLSTNDTSYISSTIIDGGALNSVITINFINYQQVPTDFIKVSGFTIRNGSDAWNNFYGGGFFIDMQGSETSIILDNLIVRDNTTYDQGSALYVVNGGNISLTNSEIFNNGGAWTVVHFSGNNIVSVENVNIYNNTSYAGALNFRSFVDAFVKNVSIHNNGSFGLVSHNSSTYLINSTISDNTFGVDLNGGELKVLNSYIGNNGLYYNETEIYIVTGGSLKSYYSYMPSSNSVTGFTDFIGQYLLESGNIVSSSQDSNFVGQANMNYNLANTSSLIGMGKDTLLSPLDYNGNLITTTYYPYNSFTDVPIADIYGNLRPNPAGSNPDMGAYENSLGTPWIEGCTLTIACNYNPEAVIDDGSCMFICPGCTSEDACNYDSSATVNDGSCLDFDECGFCGGDNSSCSGCTDIQACNYNPSSIINDGSCVLPETNYDCFGDCIDDTDGDGVCDQLEIFGCTDVSACNYDPNVTESDGLCDFVTCVGCMYEYACNYNPEATIEDNSSCEFGTCSGCTDPQACNYNPTLSEDDGSCEYCSCGYICVFESCGDQISHDNYTYSTVQIGDQCWFSENCRYLPSVTAYEDSNDVPMYYVYDYEGTDVGAAKATDNYETYGVLYNWPAVMTEGICPSGWHIPSDGEWQTMEISLGMSESEAAQMGWRGSPVGDYMKSTSGWDAGGNGSNSSGFDGRPGGYADASGFNSSGKVVDWWSSSYEGISAVKRSLYYLNDDVNRNHTPSSYGLSARCVIDYTDECGILNGDNSTCSDDCGVINGDNSSCLDECGVPNGDGSSCLDCCGVPNGDGFTCEGICGPCGDADSCLDECGVPNGDGSSCLDECGVPNGDNSSCLDECGVLNGDNSSCLDECGVPNGGGIPEGNCDCAGNQLDALGICGGDCISDADSDGVCDDVDDCVGSYDECGICNGDGAIYECGCSNMPNDDCDCFGNVLDIIGVCGGDCVSDINYNSICDSDETQGCIWPGACNYNPIATLDDTSCIWPYSGEDCEGNCTWESVATNSCESFAGLNCVDDLIAIGPSHNCGEGSRIASIDPDGHLVLSNWYDETLFNEMVSNNIHWNDLVSLGIEPLSGQLYGVTSEGEVVSEESCFDFDIPNVGDIVKVDMENNHGLLLRFDGIVVSFADTLAYDALQSTPIIFNYAVEDIACGYDFNVAVDGSQNLLFWGAPNPEVQYGYLGLPFSGGFVSIDAFGNTVGAITNNGEIVVWGEDQGGVVSLAPSTFDLARQVALGEGFGVMVKEDGSIYQWGTGTGSAEGMPSPPFGLETVVEITCSSNQVAAYLSDGTMVHWGIDPLETEVDGLNYMSASELTIQYELCIPGCTSEGFSNYDNSATIDDGSCANFGCTDSSALNYNQWADLDDGSCIIIGCMDLDACNYNPDASIGLEKTIYAIHEGVVGETDLSNQITYRLYLSTPNSDDILTAVAGMDEYPLILSTTTSFYQEEILGNTVPDINLLWMEYYPELAFDSWVTIGATPETYNISEPIYTIESPYQPWVEPFESGGDIFLNDNIGGAWYSLNTFQNGIVGEDKKVLIAQLTTDGELSVESMYVQIMLHGDSNGDLRFQYQDSQHGCIYIENENSDCNGCISDEDGDGVCDELEVSGCTSEDACNYNYLATDDDGNCRFSMDDLSINLEMIQNHTDGELEGYKTYRLYAEMTQPEDRLDAVYGSIDNPLIIQQGQGQIYQHPDGSSGVAYYPEVLLANYPLLAYDSYVALGWGHEEQGGSLDLLESPENPWTQYFEMGLPIVIDDLAGGGWYVINNSSNFSSAGEDLKILLGQFTTKGGISGTINIQAVGCGSIGTYNMTQLNFSSDQGLLGCTDSSACNYDNNASTDDGSCCYNLCLSGTIGTMPLQIIDEDTQENIEPIISGETFTACISSGCYSIIGAETVELDGVNVTFMNENDFIIEAVSSGCLGCTNPSACNYDEFAVIDNNTCVLVVGDLNDNQYVEVNDMLILLSQFNTCNPEDNCVADIDLDGYVSVNDLLLILSNFGTGCE